MQPAVPISLSGMFLISSWGGTVPTIPPSQCLLPQDFAYGRSKCNVSWRVVHRACPFSFEILADFGIAQLILLGAVDESRPERKQRQGKHNHLSTMP